MALSFTYLLVITALLLVPHTFAAPSLRSRQSPSDGHWVDTWASMPQLTETSNLPPSPFTKNNGVFPNSTLRQTVYITVGASRIRIRISNAFGTTDLPITSVAVALPANGAAGTRDIQTSTLKTLTFSGNASTVIPNGALAVSDPIDFTVKSQSNLAVTMYLATGQSNTDVTSHPGSRTMSWFSIGNFVNSASLTDSSTQSAAHWYFISTVEVWLPTTARALAIIGDSITDGRGSTDNQNNRWPDRLLSRMQANADTASIAVLNQAAGGNRVLADGLGPNALGRIDRDVLAHSGVRYAMIFEGVNDIGTAAATTSAQQTVGDRLIWAFSQIATRVRAQGIPIFAATITPFSSPSGVQPYSDPTREATRQRVNNWIRTSGTFDGIVDFDAILRSSSNPAQLDSRYNSGDYLHPNVAGYQALADAFPLLLFTQFSNGVSGAK